MNRHTGNPMNSVSRYVDAGRFGRSHALKGEVRLHVKAEFSDWVKEGQMFFLSPPSGERIPARFVGVRRGMEDRPDSSLFFVQIDRVNSREKADALRDTPFLLERTGETMALLRDGQTSEPGLEGYEVFDGREEGEVPFGVVLGLLYTPAHPVLRVRHKTGEVLVPQVDAFILEVDETRRRILGRDLSQLILEEEE